MLEKWKPCGNFSSISNVNIPCVDAAKGGINADIWEMVNPYMKGYILITNGRFSKSSTFDPNKEGGESHGHAYPVANRISCRKCHIQ